VTTLADWKSWLSNLADDSLPAAQELFAAGTPIQVARAPGRLDVMGGIGDYSGSLVLEMPIAEAACAAVQRSDNGDVAVASLPLETGEPIRRVAIPADNWVAMMRADYDSARRMLGEVPDSTWAAYVLGPVLVLLRETDAQLPGGLRILLDSLVPEGKGVSSSAAVEVATLRAVAALAEHNMPGEEIARLCQIAENRVVGAPCGIMDQMTSAVGRQDQLLALRCQPATVEGFVPLPAGIAVWGIDSGIRHAVSGSDYTSVRSGAFMGYRILAEAAGLEAKTASGDSGGTVEILDPKWHGYLANVTPAEFRQRFADAVPREMSGREFLTRYGGTTDTVTRVDPNRTYAVREPTLHPIEENARVHRFRELLVGEITHDSLCEMGQLMYAAHASYTACGLASDGTDLLVQMVRDRGPASGLFGAKITGGGSGGTVAVLGRADAEPLVDELAHEYRQRSGRETYVFRGSSPGAWATAVEQVTLSEVGT
jgi:L-arabinokinase